MCEESKERWKDQEIEGEITGYGCSLCSLSHVLLTPCVTKLNSKNTAGSKISKVEMQKLLFPLGREQKEGLCERVAKES